MKEITYKELLHKVTYGNMTAFVDENGRYRMFCLGEINDDTLLNFKESSSISIYNMSELPKIREMMREHFLEELKPEDDGYDSLVAAFEENQGHIVCGDGNGRITHYMLVIE